MLVKWPQVSSSKQTAHTSTSHASCGGYISRSVPDIVLMVFLYVCLYWETIVWLPTSSQLTIICTEGSLYTCLVIAADNIVYTNYLSMPYTPRFGTRMLVYSTVVNFQNEALSISHITLPALATIHSCNQCYLLHIQGWSNVHFSDWFSMILRTKKWFSMVESFIIWLWLHASAMKLYLPYLYQSWLIFLHFKPV